MSWAEPVQKLQNAMLPHVRQLSVLHDVLGSFSAVEFCPRGILTLGDNILGEFCPVVYHPYRDCAYGDIVLIRVQAIFLLFNFKFVSRNTHCINFIIHYYS